MNHSVSSIEGSDRGKHRSKVTTRYSAVDDNRITNSHEFLLVIIVIGVGLIIITLIGFIMSGGMAPINNDKAPKSLVIEPLDLGEINGRVVSHNGLSANNATVAAHQKVGFYTSVEKAFIISELKRDGYTAKSSISTDGTFSFNLPSGVYDLMVFYHDGKLDLVKDYFIWPNERSSIDFNHQ